MSRTLTRIAPLLTPALPRLLRWLSEARAARRQRVHLLELDARMLRDIGLTDAEALREARRSLWDVPDRWRR